MDWALKNKCEIVSNRVKEERVKQSVVIVPILNLRERESSKVWLFDENCGF